MKRVFLPFLVIVLSALFTPQGSGQQQTDESSQAAEQPPSTEEQEAWSEVEAALGAEDKARLARQFLENFPSSVVAPFAHQILALHFLERNESEKFIQHAETALPDLPEQPTTAVILTSLAMTYAQNLQSADSGKAITRGQKALQLIEMLQKPEEVPETQWKLQVLQLQADSNYALGTGYLYKFMEKKEEVPADVNPDLTQAIEYFKKTVQLDPGHDRAHFRLGDSWAQKNEGEKSLNGYARAAALGDAALVSMARKNLKEIYEYLHPKKVDENDQEYQERVSEELDKLIAEEHQYIQKKIGESPAELQQ